MILKLAHQCRLRPANAETTQKLWQYVRELPDPNEDLSPNLDTPLAAMISMEGKLALELMQELLARGADPDRTDAVLSSPLHKAVELQSTDKVQVLLSAGANPLAVDHRSQNPLHLACTAEDIEVARLLVDAAPEAVLQEDSFGCTPVNLLEDRCLDSIPTEMLELMNQARRRLDP